MPYLNSKGLFPDKPRGCKVTGKISVKINGKSTKVDRCGKAKPREGGYLKVNKKKYTRESYKRRKPRTKKTAPKTIKVPKTNIPSTTFFIEDKGYPGRGPIKIPIRTKTQAKKAGRPGGYLTYHGYGLDKSIKERHKALDKAVKDYGAKRVYKRLLALRQMREKPGIPGPSPYPITTEKGRQWHKIDNDMKYVKKKHKPDLTPRKAIKKWKKMSHKERTRRMPGG